MRFAGNFHPEMGLSRPRTQFHAHGPNRGGRHGDRRDGRCRRGVVAGRALGARCGGRCRQDLGRRAFAGAAGRGRRSRCDAGCRCDAGACHSAYRDRCAGCSGPGGAAQSTGQRSTHTGQCANHAPTERAACYGQCAADCAASALSELAQVPPRRRRRVSPRCRRRPPVIEASPPATNNAVVSPVPLAPQKDAIKPAAPGQTIQQPQRGPQPAVAAAPKKKPEERGLGPVLRRLFSAN